MAYYEPLEPEACPIDHSYKSMPVFIFRSKNGVTHDLELDLGYYGLPQVRRRRG